MAVMRTMIVGAVLAGCLAGPAFAQKAADPTPMQIEEKQRQREADSIDQQYKSTLQRTRSSGGTTAAKPAADDPWSNMRGSSDSKTKR